MGKALQGTPEYVSGGCEPVCTPIPALAWIEGCCHRAETVGSMQNLILALHPAALPAFEAQNSLGGSSGPDLTRYFLVCAILIVVTALVAWGLKKLIAGNLNFKADQRSLQVVDMLNLGGRRKLAVIRCYDRTFVIGLGEKEIAPIAELDPVIGETTDSSPPKMSDREAFAVALEKVRQAMPQKNVGAGLLVPGDRVAPALARKLERSAPPIPKPEPQKKRVRRKVARRKETASEGRRREAEAMASAALDLAAAKRNQPQTSAVPASPQVVEQTQASVAPAKPRAPKPPSTPRLEGILG